MVRSTALIACVTLTALLGGCGDSTNAPQSTRSPDPSAAAPEAGHSHGEGPNGGTVADWGGGEYHVEFTVDHDMQEATVYILDSNATHPAPITAEKLLLSISAPAFQVELMPLPLDGEPAGTSSRFVGQHEQLGVVQEFAGTVSGEVDGTPYAGDFKEQAHLHAH